MDDLLLSLAAKYIWWKTPDDALRRPQQVIAQVMNIGDYADVLKMIRSLGEDRLRDALRHAAPGQFSPRSWHYWHYRLDAADLDQVPPLPQRKRA